MSDRLRRQENLQREIAADNERAAREQANRAAIEEGERQRIEEQRRALNEDPAIVSALQRIDREEEEATQRARAQEEARHAEARQDVEQERARQLNLWESHGGSEKGFERAWPEMERRYLAEKTEARRSQVANPF